jgi:hypothetical protein
MRRYGERRAWRRLEQTIVAEHRAGLAAALDALVGSPVQAVSSGPAGTVTITLPGWHVGLGGVSPAAVSALTGAARPGCQLAGAGRYGRFWWLAVTVDAGPGARPAVMLGAWLRLHPESDGAPPPGPLTRREYSLP